MSTMKVSVFFEGGLMTPGEKINGDYKIIERERSKEKSKFYFYEKIKKIRKNSFHSES